MSNYISFAEVYDKLMDDVDYKARTAYLLKLFEKHDKKPTLLLDVACGTGNFSNEMAENGIEVIGIDSSEEMLLVARENSANRNNDILYLCQKAEEIDLFGTVDGAISCLDSLNHITDYKTLCKALERVTLFLETGRLFIFDLNTVFKHKYILGDNTYIIERDGVFCSWQNSTDDTYLTDIALDFFTYDGGVYRRTSEDFYERGYTETEIEKAASAAGLRIVAIYDDMTENPLNEYSERAIYVTEKIAETKK